MCAACNAQATSTVPLPAPSRASAAEAEALLLGCHLLNDIPGLRWQIGQFTVKPGSHGDTLVVTITYF